MTGKSDRERPGSSASGPLLSVTQLVERLQLSRAAAYRLMKRLPGCVYIGKSIRVPEAALECFLESGGDSKANQGRTATIFTDATGHTDSRRTLDSRSDSTCSNRTKHWLSRLRSSSEMTLTRRGSKREERD